ncbi:MAG: hypothetical protein M3066_02425, partial [Actinomycetota bacterium]|nr:hypothetical protein [Actinomycetota bacterium]
IRGSLDFLQRQPGVAVGIYSFRPMWMKITGGVPASVPNWVPGARNASEASARCNQAFSHRRPRDVHPVVGQRLRHERRLLRGRPARHSRRRPGICSIPMTCLAPSG